MALLMMREGIRDFSNQTKYKWSHPASYTPSCTFAALHEIEKKRKQLEQEEAEVLGQLKEREKSFRAAKKTDKRQKLKRPAPKPGADKPAKKSKITDFFLECEIVNPQVKSFIMEFQDLKKEGVNSRGGLIQ